MSEQFGDGEQLRIGPRVGLRLTTVAVAEGPPTDTGVEEVSVAHAAIASVLPAHESDQNSNNARLSNRDHSIQIREKISKD